MAEGIVRRHPTRGPGYAEVRLPGAAAAAHDPRLRIHWEAGPRPCLGPEGFRVAEATLLPAEARAEGADLVLTLGPDICAWLETDTYDLFLPALANRHFVLPWVEIPRLPHERRGTLLVGARKAAPAAAGPLAAAGEDETVLLRPPPVVPGAPAPSPAIDPAAPARTRNWPLLLLLLVPLLAAGGWWWWQRPAPAEQPEEPRVPAACLDDTATPVARQTAQEIVARPDCPLAAYVAIAEALQGAGRYDDALLVLERAAERGDAAAMGRLARLYDPEGFEPGRPFAAPDPRQAARWYRDAVRAGDAASAAPRAVLHARLERAAAEGDTMARLTLEDYWP